MKAVFLRLLEANDKERALQYSSSGIEDARDARRFAVDPQAFRALPRSLFAYWVSAAVRRLFTEALPFEDHGRVARQGLVTADDFRFVRLSFEAPTSAIRTGRWRPFAKGGAYAPYYADLNLLVSWGVAQRGLEAFGEIKGNAARSRQCSEHYFRPGLTWPLRTDGLSFRVFPAGCIFSHKGPAAFVGSDDHEGLLGLLAVANSRAFGCLVSLQLARTELAQSYEVGLIQRTPVPSLNPAGASTLASLARYACSLRRSLDTRTENSHAFSVPALVQASAGTLADRAAAWADRVQNTDTELAAIQAEIDDRCFALYGINDEDRRAITEGFGGTAAAPPAGDAEGDAASALGSSPTFESAPSAVPSFDACDPDDSDESVFADATVLTAELLSWSLGVAFGRFDARLTTGERALPPEPDPFDPLPVCSPGMLTGADGLPCATPPSGYPINFPQDGVLLDDPGHPRDLCSSARAVFDVVFVGEADARWQEAAGILDPKNQDLRAFVARTFFEQHLKRYSKSRRKAPIYWQLATPSASYSVWLYAHRLTPDTFFHVLHDVVAPKLGLEERKLLSLTQESGPNPTASQRKEIAGQEAFVDELRAFRDEIARVAPLWKPDLDDGVVLTMAPLWRLVPQHRAWQKELKGAWDSLSAGEYDWAHVAMHLWPERVVPKCATDRSLAIAHGLEEVFWEEDAKGKWAARKKTVTPVATLVAERTSPAVKAALKDLLEAPVPGGAARATGRGKRRNG